MITHLIRPFPDELMYSMVARIRWLSPFGGLSNMVESYFGGSAGTGVMDLTPKLGELHLTAGDTCDPMTFIRNHTLLPFYVPFLSPKNLGAIENRLKNGSAADVHILAGLLNSPIPRPKYLRFCPSCAAAERERTGEAYWHRLHQISGVSVCPIHNVFLRASKIEMSYRSGRPQLFAAEDEIKDTGLEAVDWTNSDHQVLVRIAKAAESLLTKAFVTQGYDKLRERYQLLAYQTGYLTVGGRVRMAKLLQEFRTKYSPSLLNSLWSLPADVNSWIGIMFQNLDTGQHPLRHLLLMDFFETSPEQFFNISGEIGMLGPGPWKCNNPVCPDEEKHVITTVRYVKDFKNDRVIGILTCPTCGQETRRTYIKGKEHSTSWNRGHLWEAELKRLWPDELLSLRQIALRLKATPDAVVGHAKKQGLEIPRLSKSGLSGRRGARFTTTGRKEVNREDVQERQAEWLELREQFPEEGITNLRRRASACHAYLRRYDKDWLLENSPPSRQRRQARGKQVDWSKRDAEFAAHVNTAAEQLCNVTPPRRIIKEDLIRSAGEATAIKKNRHRLPLTHAALAEATESPLSFALRNIAWMAAEMRRQSGRVDKRELTRRARSHHISFMSHPDVMRAIEAGC